ncbi:MAG: undecaprenyl-diphosphate phosphatase [Oscillospiraceae bacterium]|jgi:undecaprenyl-diphosphatase
MTAIISALLFGLMSSIPISSYMIPVFAVGLMNLDDAGAGAYTTALKIGILASIIVRFRRELLVMLREIWKLIVLLFTGRITTAELTGNGRLAVMVLETMIPIPLYLIVRKGISALGYSGDMTVASICFLASGVMMIFAIRADKKHPDKKRFSRMAPGEAVIDGAGQFMSCLPGFSRTAAAVSIPVLYGYDGEKALEFSYLMYVPFLAADIIADIISTGMGGYPDGGWMLAALAAVSAAGAYLSISAARGMVRRKIMLLPAVFNIVAGAAMMLVELAGV